MVFPEVEIAQHTQPELNLGIINSRVLEASAYWNAHPGWGNPQKPPPHHAMAAIFDQQGEFRPIVGLPRDPFNISAEKLKATLDYFIRNSGVLVDSVLADEKFPHQELPHQELPHQELPHGYNQHGETHINPLWNIGMVLLPENGTMQREQARMLTTYMMVFHDIGMLQEIAHHPTISAKIVEKLVPGITSSEFWPMLQLAIQIHDSSSEETGTTLDAMIEYWNTGKLRYSFSPKEQAIINDPRFREAFCAFIIADKIDTGLDRIPSGIEDVDTLGDDTHFLINLFSRTDSKNMISFNEDGGVAIQIEYSPRLTQEELERYPELRGTRYIMQGYRYENWSKDIQQLYKKRWGVAGRACAALLEPYVDGKQKRNITVTVALQNNDSGENESIHIYPPPSFA